HLAVPADAAHTEYGERQVRERCQITRCADRSLRRNARQEPRVDEPLEKADQLDADTRETLQQARELQYQGQPYNVVIEQRAHTGAVGENAVPLQQTARRRRDSGICQQSEAGVDSVGRGFRSGETYRRSVRLANGTQCFAIAAHAERRLVYTAQLG